MNFYDALYKIAKEADISINNIGLALGMSDRYVHSGKARGSLPIVSNAAKMVKVCGYTLCAVKDDEVTDSMVIID